MEEKVDYKKYLTPWMSERNRVEYRTQSDLAEVRDRLKKRRDFIYGKSDF